jgi:hypothetical protein
MVRTYYSRTPRTAASLRAIPLGSYKGKPVTRWPVLVESQGFPPVVARVIAHTSRDAAAFIWQQYRCEPGTQFTVIGPKGGVAHHRYVGWETAIGQTIGMVRHALKQGEFFNGQ